MAVSPLNDIDALQRASRHFAEGKLRLAKDLLDSFLDRSPNSPEALFLRAGVSVRTGELESAAIDLGALHEMRGERYETLVLLALVRKGQNQFFESISLLEKAIRLEPGNPAAYNTLGMCFLQTRDLRQAIASFQQAVQLDPRSGPIYQNLGLALKLAEKRHLALEAFRKAVQYAPENPSNFLSLSQQYRRLGRRTDALNCLETGQKKHPECLSLILELAGLLGEVGQSEAAQSYFEKCMKAEPSAVQAYALWLQDEGRFEDAIRLLWNSISSQPRQGLAYMALAEAKVFEAEDGSPWVDRIEVLLERGELPRISRMYLWYAYAKAKEHFQSYEVAMTGFEEANNLAFEIYNKGRPFDHLLGRSITDRTLDLYQAEKLEKVKLHGSRSRKPIFIVGMIRSGTTLLDQIVSSHSLVKQAGELEFWMEESDRLYALWKEQVNEEDLPEIAQRYLTALEASAGTSHFITDKMPLNFLHLGHIHACLPEAKILHIRRNPVDTCLSIFATHFGGGPNFAYRKENIVFYYQEYLRLMNHWRKVLPKDIMLEIDYESLVKDKEATISAVLAFCGLDSDEACFKHEKKSLPITTPSRVASTPADI